LYSVPLIPFEQLRQTIVDEGGVYRAVKDVEIDVGDSGDVLDSPEVVERVKV